jgi:amidohydrolase
MIYICSCKAKIHMLSNKIKELAARYYQETVSLRQQLHQHPELSFQEKDTASAVSVKLSEYGIEHTTGVSGHGIVAHIRGRLPDTACLALRAELDALPIQETNTHNYCSQIQGVMHACGHDAHMAMLLTAGRILNDLNQHFEGTIKLIFQPAEEVLPGGALGIIESGALLNPDAKAMIAQHVLPTLESGKIGFRPGAFMASGDEINIRVKGRGGHAAMPDQINDTVLVAAQIIVNLQQIVSRLAPPSIPTVLSFGRVQANGLHNIIPDEVLIQGTFRTFDEKWRSKAKEHIINIATHTAAASGAKAEVLIDHGYPFLVNDIALTQIAAEAARVYAGPENVVELEQRMTTEDFAHYAQHMPSCFYRLGTGNTNKGISAGLHSSNFDIDESSLELGSGLMAWIALEQLRQLQ